MKKVIMFSMGTRGDIQPYIYLAQELTRNGYDVIFRFYKAEVVEDVLDEKNIRYFFVC